MKSLIQTETQFSGSVYLGDDISDIHYTKGSIYFGDGGITNYSRFDNTGKLTISGTGRVYNTIYIPAYSMIKDGVNEPVGEIYNNVYYYKFDINVETNKYLFFNMTLPNDYAEGTAISFIVYCLKTVSTDNGQTATWDINYRWSNIDTAIPSDAIDSVIIRIDTDNRYYNASGNSISGVSKKVGSVITGYISRNLVDNSIGVDMHLLGVGISYLVDSLGSTNRITK